MWGQRMTPFVIVAVVLALIGIAIFLARHFDKKRTEALKAVADALGFAFSAKGNEGLLGSLREMRLFSQGHGRKIKNAMSGFANGVGVTIFDYRYTVGSGKNSHTYAQTVALFESDGLQAPAFALRPENLFHKIGSAFGYQDIDFRDHPSFSKKYLLRGTDEASIRRMFTDELLDHYERRDGLSAEGAGDRFVHYRSSKKVAPEKIRSFFEEAYSVFAMLSAAT